MEALTVRLQEASEQLCELKTRLVNVREAAAASKARSDCQVDKRDRDATIGALELQDASRTKLEAVKAKLTCFSHVGSAPAEPHREREFMGDTRAEDRAVGTDIVLTLSRLQSVLSAGISRSGAIQLSGSDGSDAECHQWKSRPPDRSENLARGCKEVRGTEESPQLDADIDANAMARSSSRSLRIAKLLLQDQGHGEEHGMWGTQGGPNSKRNTVGGVHGRHPREGHQQGKECSLARVFTGSSHPHRSLD